MDLWSIDGEAHLRCEVSQVDRDYPSRELAIDVSIGTFAARARIWVFDVALGQFLEALFVLEHDRRGSAKLTSMSPGNLEVEIVVIDSAGHVIVNVEVADDPLVASGHRKLRLSGSFELAPTSLPRALADFRSLAAVVLHS